MQDRFGGRTAVPSSREKSVTGRGGSRVRRVMGLPKTERGVHSGTTRLDARRWEGRGAYQGHSSTAVRRCLVRTRMFLRFGACGRGQGIFLNYSEERVIDRASERGSELLCNHFFFSVTVFVHFLYVYLLLFSLLLQILFSFRLAFHLFLVHVFDNGLPCCRPPPPRLVVILLADTGRLR